MTPCIMFKFSQILKPYRWLVLLCVFFFGTSAFLYLPRAELGENVLITELPHILILLGLFWTTALLFILIFCRGLPQKPLPNSSVFLLPIYYFKLVSSWFISIYMSLFLGGLVYGTFGYPISRLIGN
jgi:hypothetical protein